MFQDPIEGMVPYWKNQYLLLINLLVTLIVIETLASGQELD